MPIVRVDTHVRDTDDANKSVRVKTNTRFLFGIFPTFLVLLASILVIGLVLMRTWQYYGGFPPWMSWPRGQYVQPTGEIRSSLSSAPRTETIPTSSSQTRLNPVSEEHKIPSDYEDCRTYYVLVLNQDPAGKCPPP